ncbi:hypothetical protein Tco_0724820 [Tanacetum coccineum]|uniref:Uncharacterized protein n=1 Tax=Tanacetum coccineum TaxID=301880 RepID=A0ABQ4YB67_9ASTR
MWLILPEVVKKELGKIAINPSYLDKTPVLKNSFPVAWRILFTFVIQVLGGNYSSTELKYVSYPRFIACALQVLLGCDYTQDVKFGSLPGILSNSNFTKDPSKVPNIELTTHMIAVNNQKDSVSPLPFSKKKNKVKSQTVTPTLPMSQGPEASESLPHKRKKPLSQKAPKETKATSPPKPTEEELAVWANLSPTWPGILVPDFQVLNELKTTSNPACPLFRQTCSLSTNVKGVNETNIATEYPPSHTKGETDANNQEKPEEPKHSSDANIEFIGSSTPQPSVTQAQPITIINPELIIPQREGKVLVPYTINGKLFHLTAKQIEAHLDKEEQIKKAEEEARLLAINKPEVIKVVREEAKKLGIHLKEAITAKAGEKFKKAQDAEHEVLKKKHAEKVRNSLELKKHKYDNYTWTISSRLKPEKITDIKIHPKTKPVVITVYRGIDGKNFDVHDPFAFRKFGIYELDELRKIIPRKKNTVTSINQFLLPANDSLRTSDYSSVGTFKKFTMNHSPLSERHTGLKVNLFSSIKQFTPTLSLTHIPANVEGENEPNTITEDPSSHTEGETDASKQEKPENLSTQHIDSKGIAMDERAEDQRKLVKASSIVRLDPDAPVLEEQIKKVREESRLLAINKLEVIKVVREEAKKLGIHPKEVITAKAGENFKKAQDAEHEVLKKQYTKKARKSLELRKHKYDNYMWTISSSRLKPEKIIDIKIYPKTKPVVITVYRGTEGRNFDVHNPFAFGEFCISKLDELREIIPRKKNAVVKGLVGILS